MSNKTDNTADQKFWDKIATGYAKRPVDDQKSYEVKLAKTQEYFTPESEVLEFGCGTGTTALIHAPHVKHILATDISDNMLDIARGKAKAQNIENVTFERWNIDDFKAPEASYDAVLAMSILHLVKDKDAVIQKAYKWLKPGGYFISSTGCIKDMNFLIPPAIAIMRLFGKAPKTIDIFDRDELIKSIEKPGFSIEHEWCPKKGAAVFVVAQKPE